MRKLAILVGVVALMSVVGTSVALAAAGHQCTGRPCTGTSGKNVLIERPGNGVPDAIYGRGGRDILRAGRYSRDTDRLHGDRGRDKIIVLDGDTRDKASGGPGRDTCYIDSSREIGPSCEVLVVS